MMNRQPPGNNDPEQQKRLMIAIILSVLILFGYHYFVERPRIEAMKAREVAEKQAEVQDAVGLDSKIESIDAQGTVYTRKEILQRGERLTIKNDKIEGSLPLTGTRIDDIRLLDHYETVERVNPVALFSPSGTKTPYYAEFGFVGEGDVRVPSEETRWQLASDATELTNDSPIILRWDNGQGIIFERKIELDEFYMFTVTERVINTSDKAITVYPYQLLSRKGLPKDYMKLFILHQGPISFSDGDLEELSYNDLEEPQMLDNKGGWIGFADKYWFAGIIPPQTEKYRARFIKNEIEDLNKARFQADAMGEPMTILPGKADETSFRMFTGEKRLGIMEEYTKQPGLKNLDLSIDFGIWSIITKPLYLALNFLSGLFGHVAWGIIVLTVLIRLAMFPLNSKSFKSMAAMKKISPQLKEIQEKHKGDTQAMQMKIMELYQREKVNPFSGCWPMLLQIPIFFALYKVVMLDIDMRHAPFPGWIDDMSVMDPTTVFNLFGLLPYDVPGFLMIGAWPVLMAFTMAAQRRLNPPPTDPMQAKMLKYMPWFFMFILAKFAAGLVIYWTWSNFLGLLQQYTIMRREGVDVSLIKGYKKSPVDEDENDDTANTK